MRSSRWKRDTNIVAVVVIIIFYTQSFSFVIVNLQRGDEGVTALPEISAGKLFKNVFGVLQWT